MNRLWVRLSLSFSLVILVSFVFIAVTSTLLNQAPFLRSFVVSRLRHPNGLIDQLGNYYQRNNSWDGVENILVRQDVLLPGGPGNQLKLVLTDAGGNVIYGPEMETTPVIPAVQLIDEGIPVSVNDRVRAYLLVQNFVPPEPPDDLEGLLTQQITNIFFQTVGVIAIIGIVAGIIASRGLTRPLSQLAQAAREFGPKSLSKRVAIKGSTEVKAVANAFIDMADALEKAELRRRNLTADVAHELRTPLSVLRANLQALTDGVYPLTQDEIERLLEQTELLSHLVNDLHELAQADSKQLYIDQQALDLSDLLTRVTQKFQPVAELQSVRLVLQVPSDDVKLTADSRRIQQVLNNLLQNALVHTPAGGIITLSLARDGDCARLAITDTGSGIPAEHLPHIFERFYRADRSRSRATGGTGLGLAIAHAIVEAHSGTLVAHSEGAGKGATFIISLPISSTQPE